MKTVKLHIIDDSKVDIVIHFLQEMSCLQIEAQGSDTPQVKKMMNIPQSILHPLTAKTFRMFSREELHER